MRRLHPVVRAGPGRSAALAGAVGPRDAGTTSGIESRPAGDSLTSNRAVEPDARGPTRAPASGRRGGRTGLETGRADDGRPKDPTDVHFGGWSGTEGREAGPAAETAAAERTGEEPARRPQRPARRLTRRGLTRACDKGVRGEAGRGAMMERRPNPGRTGPEPDPEAATGKATTGRHRPSGTAGTERRKRTRVAARSAA